MAYIRRRKGAWQCVVRVFGEHRRDVEEKNKLSGIETILGIKA